jgi:hypothetical protein
MVDVFLMGTAGSMTDPHRSRGREPIKAICKQLGVQYYDPTEQTRDWDETMGRREVETVKECKVIVMAITGDTAGFASLAESGWAALSALKRGQAFGLYITPEFVDRKMGPLQRLGSKIDALFGYKYDSEEAASRRARTLSLGHAMTLAMQFPDVELFIANDLPKLTSWTETRLKKLKTSQVEKQTSK